MSNKTHNGSPRAFGLLWPTNFDTPPLASSRNVLLKLITHQHLVLDSKLKMPAPFRGLLRRFSHSSAEKTRVTLTFNWLIIQAQLKQPPPLDGTFIQEIHDRAIGGRQFRKGPIRVGHRRSFANHEIIAECIKKLSETESWHCRPAPLFASEMHLDLMKIHPFSDGNGRTARLLAAYILMRAGYLSTLFTLFEQHFEAYPPAYITALNSYHDQLISRAECIDVLLRGMASRAFLATWFYDRLRRLRKYCDLFGIHSQSEQDAHLMSFELVNKPSTGLLKYLAQFETPLTTIFQTMTSEDRRQLLLQLARIQSEPIVTS